MIKHDHIQLVPISSGDEDIVLRMRNDLSISDQLFSDPPLYDITHEKWLTNLSSDTRLDFLIMKDDIKEDHDLYSRDYRIGRIYLHNIDYRNFKAEYGIMLLPKYQREGTGYIASKMLFDYVFSNLPINKISLKVFSDNSNAIKLYNRLGFVEEGVLRQEYFKKCRYKDVVIMALFTEGWKYE